MEPGKRAIDQAILRLLAEHDVPDQATLLDLLAKAGFSLTQGTLSRRLARLSIRKRGGRYQRVPSSAQPAPPYSFAQSSPNLLVLQTHHGLGHALSLRVDRSSIRGAAGTVAGEDALFIAIHGDSTMDEVRAQVEQVLGPARNRI
jgi:transcriptional regulator of arginine metabolism